MFNIIGILLLKFSRKVSLYAYNALKCSDLGLTLTQMYFMHAEHV